METCTTKDRLKWLMNERNLRQVDILRLCQPYCDRFGIKIGRNDLSQYVTGKVAPGQRKLTVLGLALGVSEVWLMGYDVPMERPDRSIGINNGIVGNGNNHNTVNIGEQSATPASPIVSAIVTICNTLSDAEQMKVLSIVAEISSQKK